MTDVNEIANKILEKTRDQLNEIREQETFKSIIKIFLGYYDSYDNYLSEYKDLREKNMGLDCELVVDPFNANLVVSPLPILFGRKQFDFIKGLKEQK